VGFPAGRDSHDAAQGPQDEDPRPDGGRQHLLHQGSAPGRPRGRAGPTRTIDCDYFHETYGEWLEADDDLIHNGVWDRASDQDREECGPCEHYDYQAIGYAWNDASAAYLASHGADWTWSGPGTSGTLAVPADKDDEWAGRLWLQACARFDAWIDGVMSEPRAGLQSAPDDDVRPRTAPGGEWVRYVSPRFDDD
jgi:hypothetical protein